MGCRLLTFESRKKLEFWEGWRFTRRTVALSRIRPTPGSKFRSSRESNQTASVSIFNEAARASTPKRTGHEAHRPAWLLVPWQQNPDVASSLFSPQTAEWTHETRAPFPEFHIIPKWEVTQHSWLLNCIYPEPAGDPHTRLRSFLYYQIAKKKPWGAQKAMQMTRSHSWNSRTQCCSLETQIPLGSYSEQTLTADRMGT